MKEENICVTSAALLIRCRIHRHISADVIFADLDRFLGRHAVLSDSVGRHKHFFSLQIQQTSSTCNKKKVSVFKTDFKKTLCVDLFFNKKMFFLRFTLNPFKMLFSHSRQYMIFT